MATRTCPSCGTQYVATVRRCIDCGEVLVAEETSVRAAEAKSTVGSGDREQVGYELPGWGNQLKVALEGMLDRNGVPRVWGASMLLVPAEFEAEVDRLIEAVEGTEVPEPDDDTPQVALEIEGLDQDTVDRLEARLIGDGVPHLWDDDGALLVAEADEEKVLAVIDEVFDEVEADHDDVDVQRVLSSVYVAADRLMKKPDDAKLGKAFRAAAAPLDDVGVPYGFEPDAWSEIVDAIARLVEEAPGAPSSEEPEDEPEDESESEDDATEEGEEPDDATEPEKEADEGEEESEEDEGNGVADLARELRDRLQEIV
ncbi:MAG: hypothetical protein KF906_01110 [Actinobacteria bacterium]|nr:hypothetical protein [Actinomycetota bacterium]